MILKEIKNPTYDEVISNIIQQANIGAGDPRIISIANECKKSINPIKKAFDWVYTNISYIPDGYDNGEPLQDVRTINNLLNNGIGNCVSYSTILSSILQNLNVPHSLVFVAFEEPGQWEHVYIKAKKYILDPTLNQPQDGSAVYNRPVQGVFNKEVNYYIDKKIIPMKLRVINGVKQPSREELLRKGMKARHIGGWFSDNLAKLDPTSKNSVVNRGLAAIDPTTDGTIGSQASTFFDKHVVTPTFGLTGGVLTGVTGIVSDPASLAGATALTAGAITGNPQLISGGAQAMLAGQNLQSQQQLAALQQQQALQRQAAMGGGFLPGNGLTQAGFFDNIKPEYIAAGVGVLLLFSIFSAEDVQPQQRKR